MRADRLISILMLLQTNGRMTAHDLAGRLEVSERTIYRDIEALGMAGIPICTERGPGGGCTLIDGYQTRLTGLTEQEVQALFISHKMTSLADMGLRTALEGAMRKLQAALPAPSRESTELIDQRFHLDTSQWYHQDSTDLCLKTIQQALLQDHKLSLHYLEDNRTLSKKIVEPYGLVAKADAWYLVAAHNCAMQVLRVERIQLAEMSSETFMRSADFDLATYWTNYCLEVETQHPPYVIPLRLAPDEIPQLSQQLSTAGYRLITNGQRRIQKKPSRPLANKKKVLKKQICPPVAPISSPLKKKRPLGPISNIPSCASVLKRVS